MWTSRGRWVPTVGRYVQKVGFRGPANGRRYPPVGTDRWSVRNVTRPTVGCYRGKRPQAL